ncbi:MAG TPA: enoyl-CoA hydratase-related protein [Casimicrobiaceae bacterium]|nr:enoyl-CoA hydratase-related protein [Casimicrobiaceae bacterium]
MTSPLLLHRDGAVATLTLNRPESLNALDPAMIDALAPQTAALAADASVRCVIIRGAGKHFMAGGDIRHFAGQLELAPDERRNDFARLIARVHAAIETLQRMPQPVVASVHGAVAGFGLSLLCACDLAIAADDAYFTAAYRHLGVTPDGGLTYALPRLVGSRKAMEIVLLGDRFGAEDALRLGLVNRVVPQAELARATGELAAALASGPELATRNAKRLLRQSLSQPLSAQLDAEAASFAACAATADFGEGVSAFLAKRPPRFGGDA